MESWDKREGPLAQKCHPPWRKGQEKASLAASSSWGFWGHKWSLNQAQRRRLEQARSYEVWRPSTGQNAQSHTLAGGQFRAACCSSWPNGTTWPELLVQEQAQPAPQAPAAHLRNQENIPATSLSTAAPSRLDPGCGAGSSAARGPPSTVDHVLVCAPHLSWAVPALPCLSGASRSGVAPSIQKASRATFQAVTPSSSMSPGPGRWERERESAAHRAP